jgi:hypothetical protein
MNPPKIWTAGHVARWHTNDCHALRNSNDTNHQHSARVALLLWHFWPDIDARTLLAALMHDLPEKQTGDMSGKTKRENPVLRGCLDFVEYKWHERNGTYASDDPRLKFCDRLDAALWAWSIDPALMGRDDWKKQVDNLLDMAYELGVSDELEVML